jgi:hypothetical protein
MQRGNQRFLQPPITRSGLIVREKTSARPRTASSIFAQFCIARARPTPCRAINSASFVQLKSDRLLQSVCVSTARDFAAPLLFAAFTGFFLFLSLLSRAPLPQPDHKTGALNLTTTCIWR